MKEAESEGDPFSYISIQAYVISNEDYLPFLVSLVRSSFVIQSDWSKIEQNKIKSEGKYN